MKIKHFEIQHKNLSWHQYSRGKAYSVSIATQLETERFQANAKGVLSEREFEVDCFLSILQSINKKKITLVELGAGWGEWCLALAGVIDHKIVPMETREYYCLAVEGNPLYCQESQENFKQQGINCKVLNAAVSDHNGNCKFDIDNVSGAIAFSKVSGSMLLGTCFGILSMLQKKTIAVPQYRLATILNMYHLNHIDILHVDIQGNEVKVIKGGLHAINTKTIDYILIGTHSKAIHTELEYLLRNRYELVVNAFPGKPYTFNGLPSIDFKKGQDGLQLYHRRGL